LDVIIIVDYLEHVLVTGEDAHRVPTHTHRQREREREIQLGT
jgi:hypothetical protein